MNEQALRLLELIGDVDAEYIEKSKKTITYYPWIFLASVAACMAILVGCVAFQHHAPSEQPLFCTTTNTTSTALDTTSTSSVIQSVDGLACYLSGPEVGEVFVEFLSWIEKDIEEEGTAIVNLHYVDKDGLPVHRSEEKYRDLDRLKALGYEIYVNDAFYDDYWGVPRQMTYVQVRLNREQLMGFPAGDTFGYTITPHYKSSIPQEDYLLY